MPLRRLVPIGLLVLAAAVLWLALRGPQQREPESLTADGGSAPVGSDSGSPAGPEQLATGEAAGARRPTDPRDRPDERTHAPTSAEAEPAAFTDATARVVDDLGRPVAGVRLEVVDRRFSGGGTKKATTDADGTVTWSVPTDGRATAKLDSMTLPDGLIAPRDRRATSRRFERVGADGAFATEFVVHRVARLQVSVLDDAGAPASSVTVSLYDAEGGPVDAVRTDTAGTGAFDGLAGGRYHVRCQVDERPMALARAIDVRPGARESVTLWTDDPAGCVVVGRILDEDGRPQRRLDLVLLGNDWPSHLAIWSATTDDAGRFEIGRVPPGAYAFAVPHRIGISQGRSCTFAFLDGDGVVQVGAGVDRVEFGDLRVGLGDCWVFQAEVAANAAWLDEQGLAGSRVRFRLESPELVPLVELRRLENRGVLACDAADLVPSRSVVVESLAFRELESFDRLEAEFVVAFVHAESDDVLHVVRRPVVVESGRRTVVDVAMP